MSCQILAGQAQSDLKLGHHLELRRREEFDRMTQVEGHMTIEEMKHPFEIAAMNKGHREGRAEGRTEALADAILDVLEARFGSLPESAVNQVRALKDESRLRRAVRLAGTEPGLAQFLANL